MKFTILLKKEDDTTVPPMVTQIERAGSLQASALGLTLSESKHLLSRIQQEIVQSQIRHHAEAQRICRQCGTRRMLKDYRPAFFKSLFGSVKLTIPRLFGCGCDGVAPGARTLRLDGTVNRVALELECIQSHLAATVPYASASKLLGLLLPVDANNAVSTVRRRALAVARRLEMELNQATVEDKPSSTHVDNCATISIGLDSGFIRDCSPQSNRSFEVIVGRVLGPNAGSRSLGFVRTLENDERVRHRLRHRVAQQGLTTERMTVFTDGDAGLRCLQLAVLPNASQKLLEYLKNNADSLVDYGKRYRAGQRISTSFIDSAVNQLIDKRMSKSQQMRWSRYGAHLLFQVRADVVDGRLADNFRRWYPGFDSGAVASSTA